MYPTIFTPTEIEPFEIDGKIVEISKCIVRFNKWNGESIKETFGNKGLINIENKPMFAELAIMTHFANDGWEVRWVETYGKTKPIYLTDWKDDKYSNQVHQPFLDNNIETLLGNIATLNSNSYSGCWDVVAYKDKRILFAEAKRTKKDRIRDTQKNWLAAGLRCGLLPSNFLVVQWDW